MRGYLLLASMLLISLVAKTQSVSTVKTGNWSDPSVWSTGSVPNISAWPGAKVTILHAITRSGNLNMAQQAAISVGESGSLDISGDFTIASSNSGNFAVAAGGSFSCDQLDFKSGSTVFDISGAISATSAEFSNAKVKSSGQYSFDDLTIGGSAGFTLENGSLDVEGDVNISGGGPGIKWTNSVITIGGDLIRKSVTLEIENSEVEIDGDLTLSAGGNIVLDGVDLTVGNELSVSEGVSIEAVGSGGSLSFGAISLSGGASILCAENCSYGPGDSPISPIDLSGGAFRSLPVTFSAFHAEDLGDGGVSIQWATSSELNNDFFTIERSSDGIKWSEMGRLKGAGTTTRVQTYNWIDEMPLRGNAYYRIKQTDFDGTTDYSWVIVYSNNRGGTAVEPMVFPNPAKDVLYFSIENVAAAEFMGSNGQFFSLQIENRGSEGLNIPVGLAAGLYQLRIHTTDGQVYHEKVIVQK